MLHIANPFAARVYHEETVSSTMDFARALAAGGEPHGTVICADFQDSGRGRNQRPWMGERGQSLLFTVLLRFEDAGLIPKALPLKTGLAVSLAIEDLAPSLSGRVLVKWPNDVMICPAPESAPQEKARKTAGILVEADGKIVYIGIGVNVTQRDFEAEHRAKAVSILQAAGALPENARFILLEKILMHLPRELFPVAPFAPWQERLTQRLYQKGRQVIFAPGAADSGRLVEGVLSGLGAGGELLLIPNGEQNAEAFVSGELRVY